MKEYQLHPSVHKLVYGENTIVLPTQATTYCEEGIDLATRQRLAGCMALHEITTVDDTNPAESITTKSSELQVLVGVHQSGGAVDAIAKQLSDYGEINYASALFASHDSYMLAILPANHHHGDLILVVGKDTDSAFYGLTTLYQVLQQCDTAEIHTLTAYDWADVPSRGFIEGYYGSPWSVSDRIELMDWSGYFKLNTYVYAPKDDELHRNNWRGLYSDEQIENELKPQAAAGNASKVRFVYALAPFHNEGAAQGKYFRFDTESHYQQDFAALTQKYLQTIDAGVRQIALLADDSTNWAKQYGPDATYIRVLRDLTAWIHSLQAECDASGALKYEGLKDTILYCPALYTYTGYGEEWYSRVPKNVQIIMTGGRVFGSVNQTFADDFITNTTSEDLPGRAPFMWVNWPCSDMNRELDYQYLVMGGQSTFLQPGVKPGTFDGIMLNPMQQSEPSKPAIFTAADYAWRIWQDAQQGRQAWEDAFAYVDHRDAHITARSTALRDLSEHMRILADHGIDHITNHADYDEANQWWIDEESMDYQSSPASDQSTTAGPASTLTQFMSALKADSVDQQMLNRVAPIYRRLSSASTCYATQAADVRLYTQIAPFVAFWKDLSASMLAYLDAASAVCNGDNVVARKRFLQAEQLFSLSDSHTVDDYYHQAKPARGGMVVVRPAVEALAEWLMARLGIQRDNVA